MTYYVQRDINNVLASTNSMLVFSGTSLYPITNFVFIYGFSDMHTTFMAAITHGDEPIHFCDVVKLKVWRRAMGTKIYRT